MPEISGTCGVKNCGRDANWTPAIIISHAGVIISAPMIVQVGLGLCDDHRRAFDVKAFVGNKQWADFCAMALREKRPPLRRDNIRVTFHPLVRSPTQ